MRKSCSNPIFRSISFAYEFATRHLCVFQKTAHPSKKVVRTARYDEISALMILRNNCNCARTSNDRADRFAERAGALRARRRLTLWGSVGRARVSRSRVSRLGVWGSSVGGVYGGRAGGRGRWDQLGKAVWGRQPALEPQEQHSDVGPRQAASDLDDRLAGRCSAVAWPRRT